MTILEHFITSEIKPEPRTGFEEETWEKVALTYQRTAPRKQLLRHLRWLMGIGITTAFAVLLFVKTASPTAPHSDLKQLDQDVKTLESQTPQDMSQDPVFTETSDIPTNNGASN